MSKTVEKRIAAAATLVPAMSALAKRMYRTGGERLAAVLGCWANLAGIVGWTPEMRVRVERELRK